jgi:hypothetical protein
MTTTAAPSIPVQILSGVLWLSAGLTLAACLSARYPLPADLTISMSRVADPLPVINDDAVRGDAVESVDLGEHQPLVRPRGSFHGPSHRHGVHWPAPSLRVPVVLMAEPMPLPVVDIDLSAQLTRRGFAIR